MSKVGISEVGIMTVAASGDISANQFQPVVINTNGQLAVSAATTDHVIGVLQNKPAAAGEAGEIAYAGQVTKCKAGGTWAIGDLLGPDGSGAAIAVTADKARCFARALMVAASGDYGTVQLIGPFTLSV